MIYLELGVRDGCASGPAVHGVVVLGGLGDLNLSGDGSVFPGDFCGSPGDDIYGLQLGIHQISVILQLPQVVAASPGQIVNVDIPPVIAAVLPDGILVCIVEQEGYFVEPLLGITVNFMDEDTAQGFVGHHQRRRGFPGFHLEIVGSAVQLELLRALCLHRIIAPGFQCDKDPAIFPGSDSIHQSVVHAADFKGHVGYALFLFPLHRLDNLHSAYGVVVEVEVLCVVRVDHHRLSAGIGVDGIAGDTLHFGTDDGSCDIGEDDLALGISEVQPIGG